MKKALIGLCILIMSGCGGAIKKKTTLERPRAYDLAKTATLSELVEMINSRYAALDTLIVSNLQVEFVEGSIETGYLEKYPKAKAYSVAKTPNSIFLNILNPLTNSTVVTMAAHQGRFQIWAPRENKYLTGQTSVRLQQEEPIFNVRPNHLLQAILVESIPVQDSGYRYFLEEAQDEDFKYYVIGIIDIEGRGGSVDLVRKLWIERSSMTLVRQQYYDAGELVSRIRYEEPFEVSGILINTEVEIERIRERYRIRFELNREGMRVNEPVREGAFEIPRPPGSELVVVEGQTG